MRICRHLNGCDGVDVDHFFQDNDHRVVVAGQRNSGGALKPFDRRLPSVFCTLHPAPRTSSLQVVSPGLLCAGRFIVVAVKSIDVMQC